MLLLFTILAVLSALVAVAVFAKRRKAHLLQENPVKNLNAEHLRPLFQPTEDEIRAFEHEENAKLDAKQRERERRLLEEKIEKVFEFEKVWRVSPDKRSTVELLRLAAENAGAEFFSEISEKIIKLWREDRIENLTARDLADLLDSHLRTLPQQERTSGACFWLKEEIAKLRSRSEESEKF